MTALSVAFELAPDGATREAQPVSPETVFRFSHGRSASDTRGLPTGEGS